MGSGGLGGGGRRAVVVGRRGRGPVLWGRGGRGQGVGGTGWGVGRGEGEIKGLLWYHTNNRTSHYYNQCNCEFPNTSSPS